MSNIDKIKYIQSNGGFCLSCGSKDIVGGDIDWDEPITRGITCNACRSEWRDVLLVGDVQRPGGAPLPPGVLPLNDMLQWRWIAYVQVLSDPLIEGPFKDHATMWAAAEQARAEHAGVAESDIFEVGLDLSTGKIFFTKLDFGPEVGDACTFTVGCGGALGRNDEGIICPQCGLGMSAEGD